MATVRRDLATTGAVYLADGTAAAGYRVVCELDRADVDATNNEAILKSRVEFTLDAAGKLAVGGAKLWPNARGTTGSRWLISLEQVSGAGATAVRTVVWAPVACNLTEGAGAQELIALLKASYTFPPAS